MIFSIQLQSLINQQLLPKMELIRNKLITLTQLIILKQRQPPQQTIPNQTNQSRLLDVYISIKKQINQIIQCIAYTISNSKQQYTYRPIPNLKLFCSNEQLVKMSTIKSNLQEIRNCFLAPFQQFRVNLNEIKVEVKNLILLCDNYSPNERFQQIHGESINPSSTKYSQFTTTNQYKITPFNFTQPQQYKKAKIKGHLYKEMNEHLSMRRNSSKEERVILNKDEKSRENIYGKLQYDQKQGINQRNKKKRFNYLEQYERQINQIKQQNKLIKPNLKESITTPIQIKPNKTVVPSTEPNSPQILEEQKDPFGVEISRIPPVKYGQKGGEQIIQIGLRQFLEDSMENGQNLQDSLELMKQRQNLNKTGCFVIKGGQQQGDHQFSFCGK